MTSTTEAPRQVAVSQQRPHRGDTHRWWALVTIALAQLMVVLDMTIVNIALPSAQQALHISNANRQWMITAYTLAFGGLLLLGGRVSDRVGRKRTFIIGLIGFAGASAVGGAAANASMLFGARALQGVFAAVLAPSALSLLTTTFSDPRERSKAFGVYGAIAGSGSAVGLIAGGLLTEYMNWRWCLYVNVPIGVLAVIGAVFMLHDRPGHSQLRLDIPGAILGCGGLVAVVYGFTEVESRSWGDSLVLSLLFGGAALLALFAVVQSRTRSPLLPLRIVTDRNRAGSFIAVALSMISMFGVFLFMTYYFQVDMHYSPVKTGLAYLPMTAAIMFASTQISARLLPRVRPRLLMVPGLLIAAGGMAILTRLTVNGNYTTNVLPSLLLLGFGFGLVMMPSMSTATFGVPPRDAGVTSATVNTSQQVGGSIGTALLNTIATTATAHYIASHPHSPLEIAKGTVHGYSVAVMVSVGVLLVAAVIVLALVNAKSPRRGQPAVANAPGQPAATSPAPAAGEQQADYSPVHANASNESDDPLRTLNGVKLPDARGNGPFDFFDDHGHHVQHALCITGVVTRYGGTRVADASLTLIDMAGQQRSRTGTAPDGSYTLPVPSSGTYVLIASAPAHHPQATTLMVGDRPVDFDVTLNGTSALAGTVRAAADHSAVADALVVLVDAAGEVAASAITAPDGTYSFANLAPGDYTLAISHDSQVPTARQLTIGDGSANADVELIDGGRLEGVVRTADGRPIEEARVMVHDASGTAVATTVTSADGTYEVSELPAGDYTVTATGYPPVSSTITIAGSDTHRHDVHLAHTAD